MLRAITSCLWLIAALALGFEAAAQPCALVSEMTTEMQHAADSEMPCHDDMMKMHHTPENAPDHDTQACCCAALLGNGVTAQAPLLTQPVPGLILWAAPMPDSAASILLEFEPPPPRA
ncbi:MAG: hypothetical protein NXH72_02005 [Hyphomonadaceae bacterium]|nr:hypothetical protein [Hyphomonadaceae bacterium]